MGGGRAPTQTRGRPKPPTPSRGAMVRAGRGILLPKGPGLALLPRNPTGKRPRPGFGSGAAQGRALPASRRLFAVGSSPGWPRPASPAGPNWWVPARASLRPRKTRWGWPGRGSPGPPVPGSREGSPGGPRARATRFVIGPVAGPGPQGGPPRPTGLEVPGVRRKEGAPACGGPEKRSSPPGRRLADARATGPGRDGRAVGQAKPGPPGTSRFGKASPRGPPAERPRGARPGPCPC